MDQVVIERPELTFSPEVADLVRETYERARVILEYGSGGSTVLASEMAGKTVFAVESDKRWTQNLQAWLDQAGSASGVHLHYTSIGKTGKWGRPLDHAGYRNYHRYPLEVWDRPDFVAPDTVLIDGRFREACFYAVMLRCTKKTVVLFDDYTDRPRYHAVERFAQPVATRGRMAKFVLGKRALPREDLTQIIGAFTNAF
ncbi:hypothetical protein [Roseovarius autotrophicus]|uniref:hypothetical protein n=1 Tax=Roseovarius autotrophicus TaxID=2824121 RepID=UPI0019F52033|nr:hypothetical protein [Roseovarius autotrophicus]MBE0452767.1 hypothetical protein [Roseovarius sp.]